MRVALVHDWLLTWRGGEKVLAALARMFPQATIHTLFHQPGGAGPLEGRRIETSALDRLSFLRRHHRHTLPLLPLAVRTLQVGEVDLVISSSHCVAKGVPVPRGVPHLSYVHAPLRYMWDRFDDYFGPGQASLPVRAAALAMRPALRAWDVWSAGRVDRFLANSRHVAQQITQRYGRDARVVYPPVELERFLGLPLAGGGQGGYFLCLGALAPYKRVDVAIEAFRRLGWPLWIAGTGQASRRWLSALPPNVKALGEVSDAEVPALYRGARALVFPGVEDFGMTPVEAQACGRPVVALARGGALETVLPATGLLYSEASVEGLVRGLTRFAEAEGSFSPAVARENARRFSPAAFEAAVRVEVASLLHRPR